MNNSQMKQIWSKRKTQTKLTPMGAIKFYCKEFCCCGDTKSWNDCFLTYCPLYAYRKGKRPVLVPMPYKNNNRKKKPLKTQGFEEKNTISMPTSNSKTIQGEQGLIGNSASNSEIKSEEMFQ